MSRKLLLSLLSLVGIVAIALGLMPQGTLASSHREAPLISKDPGADNTDLYAFVSPDKPDTVTIIANYIPLEEPAGGPNFNAFADDVLYSINIDNTGDGQDDIQYQFRFKTKIRNENTFLYNTGTIDSLDDPDWNMPQFYSVTRVKGGDSKKLGDKLSTPPVNVGPRSTPNYAALAANAVHTIDGGIKVFAGQRDDPFYVDLGSIFDLAGLRPFNPAHIIPLPQANGVDDVSGFNTHTIAIQIPISQLKGPNGQMTIGVYASALRQKTSVLRDDGTIGNSGPWVQVSRLGEPLINEAVIPLGKKDFWNRSDPADDAQFKPFYTNPEVTRLENALYPVLDDASTTNRNDLVAILLTGVPGLNFTGNTPADLLRLNMAIPPCITDPIDDAGACRRLGVLDGDLAGFPNGRRLEDDIVDIELRAFAEGYGSFLNGLLGLPNRSPNNTLSDGVDKNDVPLLSQFPYVGTPHQGYEHIHNHSGT
ncbi:MAG TPA: DUF4331 domain-containing protein [Roseiflexaceae bacterium]|nr:DUF4331 domain-containing protein [Roseiflexaceae bacterium]